MTTDVTGFIACDCAADRVPLAGGLVLRHRPLTGRALPRSAGPRHVDLHVYGVFQPEFFGIVVTQARLTLEHALGARFIEAQGGRVSPHRTKTKESQVVETDDFAALGVRFAEGWRRDGNSLFNGSLASLLRWAHQEGLLRLWLTQIWEPRKASIQMAELTRGGPGRRIPSDWDEWNEARRADWWEMTFRPMWERD